MRLIIIAVLFWSSHSFGVDIITRAEVSNLYVSGFKSEVLHKTLQIGNNINIPIEFSITSKGNGGFSLPGLALIKIYDQHHDQVYFKSSLLRNELLDIDADGYKELLLWGIAVKTDTKLRLIRTEVPVIAIIKYDPKSKLFILIKKSEEIDIFTE